MIITRTQTFDLAYRFVTETNLHLFLTGKAGTGKTTFLKYLRENSFKKMVVAAPTGVAAINAGGVTLHSLFQLPFAPFIPAVKLEEDSFTSHREGGEAINSHSLLSKIRYQREKLNLFRNLELLIIDEASMVASHTVDAIDTILKSVRRRHHEPFGGVQVLFIGDLHQLQPVVKRDEWQILRDYYNSIFFFDSLVLKENPPVMIELKDIFRQKDDLFIGLLNEIRHNTLTRENFDLLNSRLRNNFFPEDKDGYITLTTHNQQADTINEKKLNNLNSTAFKFRAKTEGDFPEHMYPAEQELTLKKGAQVMFIKNDTETKKYFNGKTGIVTALSEGFIKVKCKGDPEEIIVDKQKWENVNYSLHPETREILENVTGSFEQYPLRLAWAITIHKSQGLTFDKVIIDAENAFVNGQVYVALSRCTSLEGLVLTSPVNRQFLGAHSNLKEWQERTQDEKALDQKFLASRQKFALQVLQGIFNWKAWNHSLQELNTLLLEHKEDLPVNAFIWFKEISDKQKAVNEVALKFNDRILQLASQNSIIEENHVLQQRIKDAANYFHAELNKWKEIYHKHPLSADTKKISRPLDNLLDEINFIFFGILHKINYCKKGFLLSDYLEHSKKPPAALEKIPSVYAGKQKNNIIPEASHHPGLYQQIAAMRKHLADISNFPLYQVFSNAAIKNVCELLPANKESLLKVKGFGKAKVKQYGDEIIELVREYCEENDLVAREIFKEKRERKSKSDIPNTLDETIRLFKEGKKVEQIALERNLAASTIEGHIARAIRTNAIRIEELIPMEEVKKIAELFPDPIEAYIPLAGIKEKAPLDVTYGKLRMVLAWLQKEKGISG